jgi:predicted acylesterase/phospholipase RssA
MNLFDNEGELNGSPISLAAQGGGSNAIQLAEFVYTIAKRRPIAALAGASAGALAVLGYASGVTLERLQNQLEGALSRNRLVSGGFHNFLFYGAWTSGRELRRNVELVIDPQMTLGDVTTPVAISVADRYTRRPVIVTSWQNQRVNVVDLVCATAAIPRVFPSQKIRGIGNDHDHVDGGIVNNLPADSLDRFGLPVVSASFYNAQPTPQRPTGFLGECLADLELALYASSNAYESKHPKSVVVHVEPEDGFNFALERKDCLRRRQLGKYAAENARLP